jgi:hypothetical protein
MARTAVVAHAIPFNAIRSACDKGMFPSKLVVRTSREAREKKKVWDSQKKGYFELVWAVLGLL